MKEGRQYVPMDSKVAFRKTGTRLAERWGIEGVGMWMLFLCACKRENPQGVLIFTSEEEAWRKLGARPSQFTLAEFFKATGQMKQTRKRQSGRVTHIVCTQWGEWNKDWQRQSEREQKARKRADSEPDTSRTGTGQAPDTSRTETGLIQRLESDLEKGSKEPPRKPVEKPTAVHKTSNGKVADLYAVHKLLELCHDADEGTPGVIASFAARLPEAAFHAVREQIEHHEPHSPSGYAVAALKSMVSEGQYKRSRAS